MHRPPREVEESLFNRKILQRSLFQGAVVFLIVLAVFVIGKMLEYSTDTLRTLVFVTLVLANIGLIFTNRSWSRNIVTALKTPICIEF